MQEVAGSCAALAASCQRQGCGHAHDEQKARHDQIRQVQTVPWRMRNPFWLLSRMIDEQHQRYRAPPCDVEASEPACSHPLAPATCPGKQARIDQRQDTATSSHDLCRNIGGNISYICKLQNA